MCRIAGLLHPSSSMSSIENTVQQMCDLQKHGGPDHGAVYSSTEDRLCLGNRRLSLLDLTAGGNQPMHYAERYTITYNGELYNYKSLKDKLESVGMRFSNHTDTEVILAGFSKWHTRCFSMLNGMFAFALWDNKEKSLYLVRDSAGIKPLYYSNHTGGIVFASEIKAFSPVPYLQEAGANTAVYQLAYGFIPEPVTTLEHVWSLPKGCWLKYDSSRQTYSLQSFRFFSYSSEINEQAKAIGKVRASITDAVERQMVADAPVGVFLSGGIDSAIIAGLANSTKKKDLHTLSINFKEEKYSEKKYQDLLAARLNSRHHSILLEEKEFHAEFPAFLKAIDMPTCDGINTWFISKFAAAEGLKAVLSGIGADELFGGYPSFKRMNKALWLQHCPNAILKLGGEVLARKYRRVSYLRIDGIRGLYLFLRGHFTPSEIAAELGGYEKDIWDILCGLPAAGVPDLLGPGNVASRMEFNLYMQDQLLRDADVMSMANSLEIRVPFLDNDVVQTAFSILENIKFDTVQKDLIIRAFSDELPEEIWNRKKMGFSFPFAEWLSNSEYVKQLETSGNKYTRKACKDFYAGKLHWSRIMSLIVLKERGVV